MDTNERFVFVSDIQFDAGQPDAWYMILPLGLFSRLGRTYTITRKMIEEIVDHFRSGIPDFRLPLKIGHTEETGKAGDVVALEARPDGLYGQIGWLERGLQLLADKAFQYLSAEVIMSETEWEGKPVSNLLSAVALTNEPYFGELTALFALTDRVAGDEPVEGVEYFRTFGAEERRRLASEGKALSDGSYPIVTVSDLRNAIQAIGRAGGKRAQVIAHIKRRARALMREGKLSGETWRRMTENADWFSVDAEDKEEFDMLDEITQETLVQKFADKVKEFLAPPPSAPTEDTNVEPIKPEEFEAVQKRAEALETEKAQWEAEKAKMTAEKAEREAMELRAKHVAKFSADLTVEFEGGGKYAPSEALANLLADVAADKPELAEKIVVEFKAIAAQADVAKLFGTIGKDGGPEETMPPHEKFVAMAKALAEKDGIDLLAAEGIIAATDPELFKAFRYHNAAANRTS